MNNNLNVVIAIEENNKRYAYAHAVPYSDNLLTLTKIKNAVCVLPVKTKKSAKEIAGAWNDAYKQNECYLFDEPLF